MTALAYPIGVAVWLTIAAALTAVAVVEAVRRVVTR